MRAKKITALVLGVGLGLFLSCKSSLLDLCPSFVSQVPPCHQHASSAPVSPDCDCPLAFTELNIENQKSVFFQPLFRPLDLVSLRILTVPHTLLLPSLSTLSVLISTPTTHFLETIRLTI